MRLKYEHIDYNPDSSIKAARYCNERFEVPWHHHPEYEIALIVKGNGKKFIGNSVIFFEPGELVMIGGGVPHLNVSHNVNVGNSEEEMAEVVVVQFPYEIFGQQLRALPEFANIKNLLEKSQRGVRIIGALREKVKAKVLKMLKYEGIELYLALVEVLNVIESKQEYILLNATSHNETSRYKDSFRFPKINEFILNNYTRNISVAEVADLANMNPTAFCRYFKNITDKPFTHYVNEIRINYACKLILDGSLSISETCYKVGFNNITHFNRQFKQLMGKTPREYKQEFFNSKANNSLFV